MTRLPALALAVALVVASELPRATAQPVPPVAPLQRPTFSPYLNLLNGGGSPALNYLGIVRPQQQMMQQFGQLQQQANLTNQAFSQALNQEANELAGFLTPTGNVAVFNNTGNYFNRFGSTASVFGGGSSAGGFGNVGLSRPSYAGGGSAGGNIGGLNRPAFSPTQRR